jgi:APA family basic amino acid/polyamine antiporter
MVAGTIIGASIFVQPSEIARHLETPAQIMVVWLACGLLTLCGAMVCAELASAFPYTGGVYVFLRDTFNQFAIDPREAAVGLGLVFAGVPVYYYLCHANR